MAINANVLSFVAGAAEQFTKNKDEFKKELRENKRRQRDWMNTYGNKVLNESKQKEEAVTSALKDLESRGLSQPDVLQLMQRHGVDAVLDLKKYVTEYEDKNGTRVDADLMNKVWKAADDFTLTSDNYGDAVSKVFGTNKAGATAPVIQEAEERSFFDKIKANLSGAYEDEEYSDFLDDPTEGIGNQSINDLRRMAAASPSMLGTEGSAVFDRSQLRGSDSSPSDRDQWKTIRSDIVLNAVMGLTEEERQGITTNTAGESYTSRSTQDQFALLKINHPEVLAEATRKVGGSLSENPAAWSAYGGQDALNAILNPPPPPEPLTPEEKAEELEQDLIDNNLTEAKPEDLGEATDAQVGEYFRDNNKDFVISNGQLVGRPDEAPFDESKVVVPILPTDYDENTFELKMQPTKKPEGVTAKPVVETNMLGGMSLDDRKKLSDWNRKYGGKFNDNGTYKLVRPRPVKPANFDELERAEKGRISNAIRTWDRRYKDTHKPETGYPDLEDLDMTLIPNSGTAE
jgi:hypothetical protein